MELEDEHLCAVPEEEADRRHRPACTQHQDSNDANEVQCPGCQVVRTSSQNPEARCTSCQAMEFPSGAIGTLRRLSQVNQATLRVFAEHRKQRGQVEKCLQARVKFGSYATTCDLE